MRLHGAAWTLAWNVRGASLEQMLGEGELVLAQWSPFGVITPEREGIHDARSEEVHHLL